MGQKLAVVPAYFFNFIPIPSFIYPLEARFSRATAQVFESSPGSSARSESGLPSANRKTFYDRYLKSRGLSFVNADMIAKEISEKVTAAVSKTAQEQATAACLQKIKAGETFCFETVFYTEPGGDPGGLSQKETARCFEQKDPVDV